MGHLDFYSRTIALGLPSFICDVEVHVLISFHNSQIYTIIPV